MVKDLLAGSVRLNSIVAYRSAKNASVPSGPVFVGAEGDFRDKVWLSKSELTDKSLSFGRF